MSEQVIWKWIGKAEFVPSCPARDLTDEEVDRRGIRGLVEESPLYRKVSKKKVVKKENENGS